MLGATGGDGDELATHVDLVGQQVGNPRIGRLHHELDFLRIIEQTLGDHPRNVDIEPLQLAIRSLEVPRRVGAAGAHDQFPALQHAVELAVGRLGDTHGSRRGCEEKTHALNKEGRRCMASTPR